MTGAYVLINCSAGKTAEVVRALRRHGLREVRAVAGIYDVVAYIEARTPSQIGDLVVRKIQSIDGIERTMTMVSVRL